MLIGKELKMVASRGRFPLFSLAALHMLTNYKRPFININILSQNSVLKQHIIRTT